MSKWKKNPDGVFYSDNAIIKSKCDKHVILDISKNSWGKGLRVKYKCLIHNETHSSDGKYLKVAGCKACNKAEVVANKFEEFLVKFKTLDVNNEFSVISKNKLMTDKFLYRHNSCGKTFENIPSRLLRLVKLSCPCQSSDTSIEFVETGDDYINKFKNFYKDEGFSIQINKMQDIKKLRCGSDIHLSHIECGRNFKTKHSTFIRSLNCPLCNKDVSVSRLHIIITLLLELNNIKHTKEFTFDDCRNILPLPFDFKIETGNGKFILLEVDGQQHYQTSWGDEKLVKVRNNDMIKNTYCENNNIQLHRLKVVEYTTITQAFNVLKSIIDGVTLKPNRKQIDQRYKPLITSENAEDIRVSFLKGENVKSISDRYQCSKTSIWQILWYEKYKDLRLDLKNEIETKREKRSFKSNFNLKDHTLLRSSTDEGLKLNTAEIHCHKHNINIVQTKDGLLRNGCKHCNHMMNVEKYKILNHDILGFSTYDGLDRGYLKYHCNNHNTTLIQVAQSFKKFGCKECNNDKTRKLYSFKDHNVLKVGTYDNMKQGKVEVECLAHNTIFIQTLSSLNTHGCKCCNRNGEL